MKTKSLLSLLGLITMFVFSANINAQTTDGQVSPKVDGQINPRLYIVTQSSATCTVCTENTTRWQTDIRSQYASDPSVIFIDYDLTDDNSMAKTRADLDRYGIYNSMTSYNTPGSVILIDPVTKQVVGTTSMSSSTQDILKSINSGSPSTTK